MRTEATCLNCGGSEAVVGFCGQVDADVGVARTLLPLTLVQLLRALHMLKL